jgi:hypothetical protein
LALALLLAGCDEGPIDLVGITKQGTLQSHPETTIGKAFETRFPGGTWDGWGTGMGENYAQFTVPTTAEELTAAHIPGVNSDKCLDGVQHPCRMQLKFRFFIRRDLKTIELLFVEAPDKLSSSTVQALVAYVYGN